MPRKPTKRSATSVRKHWALYPGSFDPVTFGHIDLVKRALKIFDGVIIAVATNTDKHPLFAVDERVAMLTRVWESNARVEVRSFAMLMVRYAEEQGIHTVIRGARMMTDFEYEYQLALSNRKLNAKIETMYLMPSERHAYLSSRLIKEAAALGADTKHFVPPFVGRALKQRLRKAR